MNNQVCGDGETKACEPGPCPWRVAVQPLYPAPGAVCPVCRRVVDEADLTVEYDEPQLVPEAWWWRAAAWLLRWPALAEPEIRERERDRLVRFGPCGCVWQASGNPMMELLCVVDTVDGTQFAAAARDAYETRPSVRLVDTPLALRLVRANRTPARPQASGHETTAEETADAVASNAKDCPG